MESLVIGLWYFFENFTSIDPKEGIFFVIEIILIYGIFKLLQKGWNGWTRQEITIGNSRYGRETHHGKDAKRISSYFLSIGIILVLFLLNGYTFQFGFSLNPFMVFKGNDCIWRCEQYFSR